MKIDEPMPIHIMRQISSRYGKISPENLSALQEAFNGNKSQDYYLGLLAGYARADMLLTKLETKGEHEVNEIICVLDTLVIFLSDYLEKTEAI